MTDTVTRIIPTTVAMTKMQTRMPNAALMVVFFGIFDGLNLQQAENDFHFPSSGSFIHQSLYWNPRIKYFNEAIKTNANFLRAVFALLALTLNLK